MIRSPRPTRAEVSDVANSVFDHADAVMLSAESSVGEYPVEAVNAMRRTVNAAEEFIDKYGARETQAVAEHSTTAALTASVRGVMDLMKVAAVATFTASGTTARLLAKNRPTCPVLALSSEPTVARRACLYYGVVPYLVGPPSDVQGLLKEIRSLAKELNLAAAGDHIVVLTGHPVGVAGGTRALIVEDIA